jgi:glycerophosphoryl diester phosphodiesterase
MLAPDGSLTAMRISAAMRADVIEQDIRTLKDGSAAVMHDSTINRTTTSTGNVSDHNAQSWAKLVLGQVGSSAALIGTAFPSEAPPLWEAVAREFGNKVCLSPEGYDTTAITGIDNVISRYSISRDTILFQTNSYTDADAAYALGYHNIMTVAGDLSTDMAVAASHHCTMVAAPENLITSTWVNAAHAAGLKAVAYAVNSRYRRDALVALGVDGFFTDDPGYLKGTATTYKTDHFPVKSPVSGFHKISGTATGAAYSGTNEFGWGPDSTTVSYRLGLHRPTNDSSFVRDFEVNLSAGIAQMFVGNTDHFTSPGSAGDTFDGYLFSVVQSDGTFRLEKWVDGARTAYLAFGVAITGFTSGSWFTCRLTVTPTQITVAFPTLGSQSVTYTDSTTRPLPYVTIGGGAATVKYRGIVVN